MIPLVGHISKEIIVGRGSFKKGEGDFI